MAKEKTWSEAWVEEKKLREELASMKTSSIKTKEGIKVKNDSNICAGDVRLIPNAGRARYVMVLESEDEGKYLCVPFGPIKPPLYPVETYSGIIKDPDFAVLQAWYPVRIPKSRLVGSFTCATATVAQVQNAKVAVCAGSSHTISHFLELEASNPGVIDYFRLEVKALRSFKV